MSLLIDAGIDPGDIDFKWSADAPSAAKIFVRDPSYDAFVGWSPDIYNVTDKLKGSRLVVTTGTANHLIADVWAVRNDFYHDHPEIVSGLVRGIFEGMDMVRKDPARAAQALATAFSLPAEDCKSMIGKDGGIAEGDAHLTNYRENSKFFLDPFNPANFEVVWNSASTIYKSLGTISTTVPAAKVKASGVLAAMADEYKDVRDLSQPTFKPDALMKMSAEAGAGQVLTKAVIISFEPNKSTLNAEYDPTIPATPGGDRQAGRQVRQCLYHHRGQHRRQPQRHRTHRPRPAAFLRPRRFGAQGHHGEVSVRPEQVQGGRQRLGQPAARLHRPEQCREQPEEPARGSESLPP